MAISVLSGSPEAATPVYNKMIFKVSGSLTSGTNYRYVCDVKDAAGTTTLARLKCDKLPTTNYGFFDVSRVVETLISPVMPNRSEKNSFYDHSGFYSGYSLTFMEEYGSTPVVQTGTTTTVSGKIAFAGNLDYNAFDNWDSDDALFFNAASGRPYPLTQAAAFTNVSTGFTADECKKAIANTPNVTNSTTAGWTAIANPTNDYWTEVRILYYDINGNITRNYYLSNTTTSGSTFSIVRFATGGSNIRSINSAYTSDGQAGTQLFPTEGAGYSVHFERSGYISQPVFYRIGPCERYKPVQLYFINRYGGVDTFLFSMKNRKRFNVTKEVYGYNSDVYGTNTYNKVWNGSYEYVYQLNSDWLTDNQVAFLSDLLKSSQVIIYVDDDNNTENANTALQESTNAAAIINTNQYQFVTRRNDKLQQLQIEVAVAYKNNIL